MEIRSVGPRLRMNASVLASAWERLAATRQGRAAGARTPSRVTPPASWRWAPRPRAAAYATPVTGTATTPSTGACLSMRAMLTVNSPLRLTKSFVPSKGSTSQ